MKKLLAILIAGCVSFAGIASARTIYFDSGSSRPHHVKSPSHKVRKPKPPKVKHHRPAPRAKIRY